MTSKHTIARMWPPLPGDCCQHFHPSYHHPQPRSPSSSQNGPSALPHAPTCNAVCPQHGSQGDTLSHIRSLLHHSSAQDLPVAPRACMCAKSLQLCLTLCDPMDCRPPLFMGFPRQEYWSGLLCAPPGDLPDPEIQPESLTSPASAGGFFTTSATWEARLLTSLKIKVKLLKALQDLFPLLSF